LLARLVFRSGWVKLASDDPTWANLTALTYHYETQPLPTVLAWYAHQWPRSVHEVSCAVLFLVELGAPVLIFVPRVSAHRIAAASIMGLMGLIAATGNYGFFNLLTIILCVPLLDDAVWKPVRTGAKTLGFASVRERFPKENAGQLRKGRSRNG